MAAKKKAKKKKASKKKAAAEAPDQQMPAQQMPAQQMPPQQMMQPGMQQPGMMPPQQMMQPGMQQPGMMPQGQMMQPGMMPQQQQMGGGGNPMMAMMQMMQMMSGGGMPQMMMDPSAMPFQGAEAVDDGDPGLDGDIIRPALIDGAKIKTQRAVPMGSVLDLLCLTDDGQNALGGVPRGCTIAFSGPPGKGKTRSALAALAKVAASGEKVAFVVAEEGFYEEADSGRDDLCSRLIKIGMAVTGMNEKDFNDKVLSNFYVLQSQYHKGHSWDDFVNKYRYLIEKEEIRFIVIDSLNMLDPTRNRTADNLSSLKTYNHEQGVTCLCIGQIRDTGAPVGGEALMHTADAVFLIEEMSLGSKDMAELWGGKYRDRIAVIRAIKSVTTPVFPHPIKLASDPETGVLVVDEAQPAEYAPLPVK